MPILIDGYNLLHVTSMVPRGNRRGELHRARTQLLEFLVQAIEPSERRRTTVVFDSNDAPKHLPSELVHRDIKVLFARDHDEADDLIEELIRRESAPARLLVVSSDHRIHKAARRRRAPVVDSDVWYDQIREEMSRAGDENADDESAEDSESNQQPSSDEVSHWLQEFGGAELDELEDNASRQSSARPTKRTDNHDRGQRRPRPADDSAKPGENLDDLADDAIFPPGYGDDLLDDQ